MERHKNKGRGRCHNFVLDYLNIYIHIYTFTYIYIRTYICIYNTCIYTYIHIYVNMRIYIYKYMHLKTVFYLSVSCGVAVFGRPLTWVGF